MVLLENSRQIEEDKLQLIGRLQKVGVDVMDSQGVVSLISVDGLMEQKVAILDAAWQHSGIVICFRSLHCKPCLILVMSNTLLSIFLDCVTVPLSPTVHSQKTESVFRMSKMRFPGGDRPSASKFGYADMEVWPLRVQPTRSDVSDVWKWWNMWKKKQRRKRRIQYIYMICEGL